MKHALEDCMQAAATCDERAWKRRLGAIELERYRMENNDNTIKRLAILEGFVRACAEGRPDKSVRCVSQEACDKLDQLDAPTPAQASALTFYLLHPYGHAIPHSKYGAARLGEPARFCMERGWLAESKANPSTVFITHKGREVLSRALGAADAGIEAALNR